MPSKRRPLEFSNPAVEALESCPPALKEPLRCVVIGVGASVLGMHRPALESGLVNLVGASDLDVQKGRERAAELSCPFFADHHDMLQRTEAEVAVVLTLHPFHADVAVGCLEAGCHVLVEKPMAVHAGEADTMIRAAKSAGRLLAVNFQHRHRPEVRAFRKLIRDGEVGRVQHVDMTMAWPRRRTYYRNAPWRGTWAGEGGGVSMNQAPHHLDLLCHLLGLPSRVVAWARTTLHQIETEDTIQAMLEWPDGGLGSLHISTAEAGRPERLELVGTKGVVQHGGGRLNFERFPQDLEGFLAEDADPSAEPALEPAAVNLGEGVGDHLAVYCNLYDAVRADTPLVCDGAEGRMSLESANALLLSSHLQREVALPLDRAAYAHFLNDRKSVPSDGALTAAPEQALLGRVNPVDALKVPEENAGEEIV